MRQNIIEYIYRKEEVSKLETKLMLFGVSRKISPVAFLNIRLFTSILLFIFLLLFFKNGFIVAPVLTIVYYLGFTYVTIDMPLKARGSKLEHEAFYFFEVMILSLESGRNLEKGIETACTYIDSEISLEFKETLYQIKFGKSLSEALTTMKKRIPSETINNILLNIIQANIFGNSLVDTLYTQIDFLRDKRIMEIKSQISKIPTKISVFSVIFFVPLILMLIIAPLIIDFIMKL